MLVHNFIVPVEQKCVRKQYCQTWSNQEAKKRPSVRAVEQSAWPRFPARGFGSQKLCLPQGGCVPKEQTGETFPD